MIDAKDSKSVIELLERNKDFDLNTTYEGMTLLLRATLGGLVPVVAYLLERGANPNIKNREGMIPLDSVTDLNSDLFKLLASKTNKDHIAESVPKRKNLLMLDAISAIDKNDINALETLFKQGLEINQTDQGGWTLLHWAVLNKNEKIVKYLLRHKADPSIKSKDDLVPIQLLMSDQSNIFKILINLTDPKIRKKVIQDIHFQKKSEVELLMSEAITAIEKNDVKKIENLMNNGLSVNQQDRSGWTLLHWAFLYKKPTIKKWLVQHDADPTIRDDAGILPSDIVPPTSVKRPWR